MLLEQSGFKFRCILRHHKRSSSGLRFLLSAILFAASVVSFSQSQQASIPHSGINDPALDQRVESLLQKMTLVEKIGQLVQYSAGQPTGPGTGRTDYDDMIRKGEVGALFNITTARQVNAYQRVAVEQSRLHIPTLFGLDVIHGFRTEFP